MKRFAPIRHGGAAIVAGAITLVATDAAFAATADPIAVQLYTMRDFGTIEEQLAAVERAGIDYVETAGSLGATGGEARSLLGGYGLAAISAHVGLDQLRDDLDAVISYNKALGNDTIVLPSLFGELPEDARGWESIGTELRGIAERLDAEGLRFAFHNHAPAMEEFDGRTGMEILLDAGGSLVKGQLDLAWVTDGGQDPVDLLDRLSGQVISVHAKDVAETPGPTTGPVGDALFAAVGEGGLNWDAILPAAERAGVEWYIVEHDNPPNAEDVIAIGNAFLSDRLPVAVEDPAPVPLPAGLPLLAGGLLAFGLLRRSAS